MTSEDHLVALRIVANDLREALYNLAYGSRAFPEPQCDALALLERLPVCADCGQMKAGHDALHEFTP